ncbi:type II toxin-antitoxin system HicA family toxin [Enterocloster lavalensis]|uniref:type II toxin-antitoxin system HicA family toxin n=1 Tax=Enterocloster lavalensis TaxID=460384 RepID=UPI001D06401E|nr:type II toxin-antitoxin system HicA family toxin [Enterocloster lavalensis]MCB6343679.1 type II toxin-antitoxin system HicA family toxin [Enterocloster lavalensis]
MARADKTYQKVMTGKSDNNIDFEDFRYMIKCLGFRERIRGDHHFFSQAGIMERINIQPNGNKAKPYQVDQVRELIKKYNLEV